MHSKGIKCFFIRLAVIEYNAKKAYLWQITCAILFKSCANIVSWRKKRDKVLPEFIKRYILADRLIFIP